MAPPSEPAVNVDYNVLTDCYTVQTPDGIKFSVSRIHMTRLPATITIGPYADLSSLMGSGETWTFMNPTKKPKAYAYAYGGYPSMTKTKAKNKKVANPAEFVADGSKWFGGGHSKLTNYPWKKGDELYSVRNMVPKAARDDVKAVLSAYRTVLDKEHDLFIAGGFLRDAVCARKPKDVDLIIITDDGDAVQKKLEGFDPKKASQKKKRAPMQFIKWNYKGGSQYAKMKTPEGFEPVLLTGIMSMKNLPEINVVIYKRSAIADMREALTAFDFGMCQIGALLSPEWLGANQEASITFLATEQFIEDVAFKTFTLVSDHSPVRSAKRFEKSLAPRYPDFTLVK